MYVVRTFVPLPLLVVALIFLPQPRVEVAHAAPTGDLGGQPLESILAGFASMPGLSADFREQKRITLLREPLISSGSIYFAPPDLLLRHTRVPTESVVLLAKNQITYQIRGDRGGVDIDSHPMIRAVTDIFRLLLVGDVAALREIFLITVESGQADRWEIKLEPREAPLRDSISQLRVRGVGNRLDEVHIAERNGDTTQMTFSAVDTKRQFSATEIEQIFRIPDS